MLLNNAFLHPQKLDVRLKQIANLPPAFSESSTADDLLNSNCTSCQVDQDRSAYWTPTLWFHGSDGKFTRVPETTGHIVYVTSILKHP